MWHMSWQPVSDLLLLPQLQDAAPGSSAGSAPKKQRQPQRRPSDEQPVSPTASAAAAAAAAAAAGLDPALVARLAAQRQQKYGCCPQKSARVPSLQAEKTAPTPQQQPQPQLAQKQRQAAQRDAPVSLQVLTYQLSYNLCMNAVRTLCKAYDVAQ